MWSVKGSGSYYELRDAISISFPHVMGDCPVSDAPPGRALTIYAALQVRPEVYQHPGCDFVKGMSMFF